MNIMDLEEADGLTIEMVHAFLQRNGWTRATLEGIEPARWARGDEIIWVDAGMFANTVRGLIRVQKRGVQAILREMNPRMRRGLPTLAERSACRYWLCSSSSEAVIMLKVEHYPEEGSLYRTGGMGRCVLSAYENCSFWPCDAYGNKVPWPVPHA